MIIYWQTTKQILIDEKKNYFELYPLNQTTVINYILCLYYKKKNALRMED